MKFYRDPSGCYEPRRLKEALVALRDVYQWLGFTAQHAYVNALTREKRDIFKRAKTPA